MKIGFTFVRILTEDKTYLAVLFLITIFYLIVLNKILDIR